ncbi:dipeptide ABC transporter ATP-binding protein [Profundibacterium mesophilum]|uniref:Glutathione import ATP-binding protein GsiA n=1 Tax=Profundibacterium mesophilum KAUST100406-0324 TaxID=1037889 RepID=A0A921NP95_9RHOB|nr:ABC transporter ATP-binding protein [Profundibacterium mesophilum]KAF0675202.1 glutathione import ATP-binding protein GsiA [Profundibacterium mesophilum KAUST100406-0324]
MNEQQNVAPILAIENLSISFDTRRGAIPAVMDFSAELRPGETLGLVGESGCGKSTVALGIMGDLGRNGAVTAGSIRFDGRDLTALRPGELRRIRGREIAMVYQEPMSSLNPALRVGRQLMEVPMVHEGTSRAEARARALRMLHDVQLPDPERIMDSYPHTLSGGQQQRIVIAMALMSEPALLILDEPTTALDVTVEAAVIALIAAIGKRQGTSILFISHNLGLVIETCDRVCVMYSGEAVETGTVGEVFGAMRHPYTQALMRAIPLPGADRLTRPLEAIPGNFPLPDARPPGCNFGPRCAYFEAGRCDATKIPMIPLAGPEEAGTDPRRAARCLRIDEIDWSRPPLGRSGRGAATPGEVVLKVEGLDKVYAPEGRARQVVKANQSLSFEARAGETLAIVGESGCGKSTLGKVLVGLERASGGSVTFAGKELAQVAVSQREGSTVSAMQMVFQNPFDTLNPSMTIGRQIIRAIEILGSGGSARQNRERMLELLDLVKLPRSFADRKPRQLSGGQKQRVGIARAFAGDATLVIADEPVSALDVSVQAAVTELLMQIQADRGTSLLFISHDLSIVRYISDRVMVLYLGHVVEIGTTDEVFAPPYHPYTEALLSAVPIADRRVEKTRIVLEGDVPSAIDPPPGCPFQTRCHRKSQVPGDLCETVVPPMVETAPGHLIKCHLSRTQLAAMTPVISLAGSERNPDASPPLTPATQGDD